MLTKHTPGPWHRNIRANGKYPVVFAGRNQHVVTVSQQKDGNETEANIDLIAAAPELLEALKALMPEGWGDDDTMDHMPGVKLARLALAKAEGRT